MDNDQTKTEANTSENESLPAQLARLEKANAEKKTLIEREERLASMRIMGGTTALVKEPEPKKETPRDYAEKIMRGGQ